MLKSKIFIVLLVSTLLLAACTPNNKEPEHQHSHGDVQEETASVEVLPTFLDNHREDIRFVYQIAGQATNLLQYMPCYCGCGESAGHTSNLNCFIKEVNENGSVVWDDHGTRCGVCLEIAVQSVKMLQDGKSVKEIRQIIDDMYKDGYAKPTKTPLPV